MKRVPKIALRLLGTAACLSSIVAVGFAAGPAHADYASGFVEITCVPALHYMAVRRFSVENAAGYDASLGPTDRAPTEEMVEKQHHVFTTRSLKRHPQVCDLPASTPLQSDTRAPISVRITAQVDENSSETSSRNVKDEVDVNAFGRTLSEMPMNTYGLTIGDSSVEIYANGVGVTIRTCSLVPGSTKDLTCKKINLPNPEIK